MTAPVGEHRHIDPEEINTFKPDIFDELAWVAFATTQRPPSSIEPTHGLSDIAILRGNISTAQLRRTYTEAHLSRSRAFDHSRRWMAAQRELIAIRLERLREAMGATSLVQTSTYSASPNSHNSASSHFVQRGRIGIVTPTSDYPVVTIAFSGNRRQRWGITQFEITPDMVYTDYIGKHLALLAQRGIDLSGGHAHVGPYAHPNTLTEKATGHPSHMHDLGYSAACQLTEAGIPMVSYDDNDVVHDKSRYSDRRPPTFGRTATAVSIRPV